MADEWLRDTNGPVALPVIDTSVPNVARVWNYLIGGRDNFEADRRAGNLLLAVSPVIRQAGPASRAFLRRAVTYLAAEAGIRQFLDIGTGLPASGSTHEIAQQVDPACRVCYVDNDPLVLLHARALLRAATSAGSVGYLDADAADPAALIARARQVLDFDQPVAVVMSNILNFLPDAAGVLGALREAIAPGSCLALTHPAADERLEPAKRTWNQITAIPVFLREPAEIASWLEGLELVPPGIAELHRWQPADSDPPCPDGMPLLGAIARKP